MCTHLACASGAYLRQGVPPDVRRTRTFVIWGGWDGGKEVGGLKEPVNSRESDIDADADGDAIRRATSTLMV